MKTIEYYEIQYRYPPETGGCNGWTIVQSGNVSSDEIVLMHGVNRIETAKELIGFYKSRHRGAEYRIMKVKMTLEKEVVSEY